MINRRQFIQSSTALTALSAMGFSSGSWAARNSELNILCWEGYNTDEVLEPFRKMHPNAKIRAVSGTSDPDMINKLRAGEVNVWDLINVNQPWASNQLAPEGLIKPLNKERFSPYFDLMLDQFKGPYPLAMDKNGDELLGMVQRFGPFSFVVNTKKISRKLAEDQGFNLFLDPKMKGRFGILTYDNWNIVHLCATAGLNPFEAQSEAELRKFTQTAQTIFSGARLLSDDLVAMNTALINGEIDAYFTGGTYTASPARYDGQTQVRAITPNSGPIDGKSGFNWVELTSLVNNPNPSTLAEDFLEFVQRPDICKKVSFTEGTYNPVGQMGNPKVLAMFNKDELNAIQWDSLFEDMPKTVEYQIVPSYSALNDICNAVKRS